MLNYAVDAGDGYIQDAAAAYPLIGSGAQRNYGLMLLNFIHHQMVDTKEET